MRNVFMVAVPAMIIACGLGSTDNNNTLPNGSYNGVATPGLNGAMTSESFTATRISRLSFIPIAHFIPILFRRYYHVHMA